MPKKKFTTVRLQMKDDRPEIQQAHLMMLNFGQFLHLFVL